MLPGTQLGRYEIISPLGAGAMGEVYRARDTKIKRDVAIKVLPISLSSNPERLQRFEQEAQAAGALNHPNILTVFDVGTHNGAPYVVSELLEGETLRVRLNERLPPMRKALSLALQVAQGLSAAHEKSIIHRDLKPENIFITKEERVKILDFGLAKLLPPGLSNEGQTDAPTAPPDTREGVIMGTVGYMSPEQVRGETNRLDHRSDIFSFGAVFYEMLTGRRAFQGRSPIETMNAILNEDPLEQASESLAPVPARILQHCLEKNREERFQSMRDLSFDLEMLHGLSSSGTTLSPLKAAPRKRLWLRAAIISVLLAGLLCASFFLGRQTKEAQSPTFSQLSFRRGTVWSARFTPDEATVVYSAAFDGESVNVYSTRTDSSESRSLELADSSILSVSSSGEMAILRHQQHLGHFSSRGTLARMPLVGTAPRPLLKDVQEADWSPDGANLAIVRYVGERHRLEYPINKLLYETAGWISNVRVSPRGDYVAFLDHPAQWDNRGQVAIVDLEGNRRVLTEEWSSVDGLAWPPGGSELWFTAKKAGEAAALYAVTLSGKARVILRAPTHLKIYDISRSGRVLMARGYDRLDFIGMAPNENKERNLSWLDRGRVRDLSSDGKTFIFTYWGERGGRNYKTYLRKMDGSPAVSLGDGAAWALSPDGSYALSILANPSRIVLLPTDVGELRQLEPYGIEQYGLGASWFPDGQRILFIGREAGKGMRCYVQSVSGDPPRPVTPEGVTGTTISPDNKYLIAEDTKQNKFIYPVDGGAAQPVNGLGNSEQVIRWSDDPQFIYVYNQKEMPARIFRFDLQTGTKKFWKEVMPTDRTGILGSIHIFLTPDGRGYIYDFRRYLSDLFLVEGFE